MRPEFLTEKRVLDELKQRLESGESDKEVVNSLIEMRIGELEASARVCRSYLAEAEGSHSSDHREQKLKLRRT